jgi:O-antigen ligase
MEVIVQTTKASPPILSIFLSWTRSSFWLLCADIYPALVAACIPWSTTAVAVFMVIWLIVVAPTIGPRAFLNSLRQPAYWLPLAFFALAIVGTLWADGPWSERIQGIDPLVKLLMIPLLLYHFERSKRGHWVFGAFLVSCIFLMGFSWIVLFAPEWKMATHADIAGVPIKNTIDQSQEFALCIFALSSVVLTLFSQRRFSLAAVCAALILGFFANLMFAALARTALVYMPVLLMLFAFRYLGRRAATALVGGAIAIAVIVWFASPYLRQRVENVAVEYQGYKESHLETSTGQRLEWWGKSIDFIGDAPLFGNGTGSIKQLFDRDAGNKVGAWAASVENPHNQTLNVAIQWGILGCLILYAIWCSHLLLFGDFSLASWVGLIVVVQNFVSSLFNSHLFDFNEGWIYVLGVGVAGGLTARANGLAVGLPALISETHTKEVLFVTDKMSDARRVGVIVTAVVCFAFFVLVAAFFGLIAALVRIGIQLFY